MTGRAGRPPARLPNDVDLMSLSFEPLSGTLFALRLRPAGEEGSARGRSRRMDLEEVGRVSQGPARRG